MIKKEKEEEEEEEKEGKEKEEKTIVKLTFLDQRRVLISAAITSRAPPPIQIK